MRTAKSNKTIEGALDANQYLVTHPELPKLLRDILRDYYLTNGRDFPWRRTRDPYKILVTEMLLQKTAVKPVEKLWPILFQRYPNVESLAVSPLSELEAIIGLLGLKKRSKALHNIARAIVEQSDGKIVRNINFLESLPGVGNYTASAILSFAFDVSVATIDVNAVRVYTRICGFSPNTLRQGLAFAHVISKHIVTDRTHREVNYGLLDLAAQICKPKPQCHHCPLIELCQFAAENSKQICNTKSITSTHQKKGD